MLKLSNKKAVVAMKRIGLKDVGSCPDVGLTVVSFAPTFDSEVGPALAPALVPTFAPAFPVVVPPAVEAAKQDFRIQI